MGNYLSVIQNIINVYKNEQYLSVEKMFQFRNVRLTQFEILILLSIRVSQNEFVLSIPLIFVPVVRMLSHIKRKEAN